MLYARKPKKKRKVKLFVVLSSFVLLIIAILLYLNYIVNPLIIDLTQSKVRSMTQKSVGIAVYEALKNEVAYDKLIEITRNDAGDIVLISSNAVEINIMTRELLDLAQKNLDSMGEDGVSVALGSFTGLPVFANSGPEIKLKLTPIGSISAEFRSEFVSAGINQTNHRIFLEIKSNVNVVLPTATQQVTTITELMIAESIIVGKIPDTYLNSSQLSEMLNLIP